MTGSASYSFYLIKLCAYITSKRMSSSVFGVNLRKGAWLGLKGSTLKKDAQTQHFEEVRRGKRGHACGLILWRRLSVGLYAHMAYVRRFKIVFVFYVCKCFVLKLLPSSERGANTSTYSFPACPLGVFICFTFLFIPNLALHKMNEWDIQVIHMHRTKRSKSAG